MNISEDTAVHNYFSGAGVYAGPTSVALTLKGDANQNLDVETYLVSSQVWKPVFHVSGAGVVLTFITHPLTVWVVLGLCFVVAVVVLLIPTKGNQPTLKKRKLALSATVPSYTEFLSGELPSTHSTKAGRRHKHRGRPIPARH